MLMIMVALGKLTCEQPTAVSLSLRKQALGGIRRRSAALGRRIFP